MTTHKLLTNFDAFLNMDIGPLAQNCLTNTVGNHRYPDAKHITGTV